MPRKLARFNAQVRRCSKEITGWLPELADRHSPLVVVAALTEHVGGSLLLHQESGACTPEQVRAIIRRVEQLTFTDCEPLTD
jgi:hypothetical protein